MDRRSTVIPARGLLPAHSATAARSPRRASVEPMDLRCEYLADPTGIDQKQPRLSWRLMPTDADAFDQRQTAYQVLVSGDRETLGKDQGDQWDSGEVASDQTTHVVYRGEPLISGQQCFWKVRAKDEHGVWSSWSEAARWTLGLLEPSEWTGKWIGADAAFSPKPGEPPPDNEVPDPWLRKTIELRQKPKRATVYVASVGYHELYVNGQKVGDAVLAPCATDHSKRARYVSYEIAEMLAPGPSVIGLWLGTSWSIYPSYRTGDKPRAPIALVQAELHFFEGDVLRVVSDASWKTHPSPNRLLGTWEFRNYGGEQYDANGEQPNWCTVECDDSSWKPAREYSPKLLLSAQMVEPDRPVKEIKAAGIERQPGGEWRVDMGVNFAGWTEVAVRGKPGRRVEFEFSERDDEAMTFRNRSAYVIGPEGRGVFRNRFNYSSGRWITIRGMDEAPTREDVRGWMVRTDFQRATRFECSNVLLNWIGDTALWTFENLALGGYVVDCPQRERFGYGGDAHATTETGMFHYRLGAFYTKWAEDWRDAQGREPLWVSLNDPATAGTPGSGRLLGGGIMPHSAPTHFGGGGPAWGGYCITLPWLIYQHYGDRRILEENLPTISAWLEFLDSNVKEGLLARFGGQWDFLGDWLWPGAQDLNNDSAETACLNNCYWIDNLTTAARIADAVGRPSEAARWRRRAAAVRTAVHARFFEPADSSYANGQMAYLAAALLAEVPPPDIRPGVMRRLEHEILVTRQGHIGAGITGGALLFKALRELRRDDLLLTMALQEDYPGWGFMRANGATTMWEAWEKDRPGHSLLHSSYLYVGAWLIDGVAGIARDPNHPGFGRFVVRPPRTDDPRLTWARCSYESEQGTIETGWRREGGRFELDVAVPPNTTATVYVPASSKASVSEAREATGPSGTARWLRDELGFVVFEVRPGRYRFVGDGSTR